MNGVDTPQAFVVAVTGLRAEARIAARADLVTISAGGDPSGLARQLEATIAGGVRGVISFGIAGGLTPDWPAGTVLLADTVIEAEAAYTVDPAWLKRLKVRLPQARHGKLLGRDRPIAGARAKTEAHRTSGAGAVDMESHIAARLAAAHGLPFAALRVVADPAERSLPGAALVGMRPDGTTDVPAVLRALAANPAELPALIRTALDARAAFSALAAARKQLDALMAFEAAGPAPTPIRRQPN